MSSPPSAKAFLLPKLRRFGQYLAAHGPTVGGNMLYGLLCVRLLPIADYAKFAVLFGYMTSLGALLDMGCSATLNPLVGGQIEDRQWIADWMANIRRIALKVYLLVAPVATYIFVLLVRRQRWEPLVIAAMCLILLLMAWITRFSSAYGALLLLCRDRRAYYRGQIAASLGSLGLLLVFGLFHAVNLWVGLLLNVAQVGFVAIAFHRRSKQLLNVQGRVTAEKQRTIVHLAWPTIPGIVFYALQGQLTLMLVTVFGHTRGVAGVGALSRLGQIYVLFSQMNVILFEPYFAGLAKEQFKRSYLLAIASVVLLCCTVSGLAFLFPGIFLWPLGPEYRALRFEVGLQVAASSIGYLSSALLTIHLARRFVYWWHGPATILLTLLVEAAFLWKSDLSTVRGVLVLAIATGLVALGVHCLSGVFGMVHGPRQIGPEPGTGLGMGQRGKSYAGSLAQSGEEA